VVRSGGHLTAHGGVKTPKQYTIVVSDIDDLIVDVFKTCSWNPVAFIGTNAAALEAITRYNNHSTFLTRPLRERTVRLAMGRQEFG